MTRILYAELEAQVSELRSNIVTQGEALTQLREKLAEANKAVEAEKKAHNNTRDVLHSTELELAKLRGYVDGINDSKPPQMVPDTREARLASYPDGSRSLPVSHGGWTNSASAKPWWHQ